MKTFVVLLLLTNLAYFGWNEGWLRDTAPAKRTTPVINSVTTAPQPFEQAPATLTLLSELSGTELERREISVAATVAEPAALETAPTEPEQAWCASLGLFEQESEAKALIPELVLFGVSADLSSGRVPVSSTFWVYIPAFASEAEAFARLEELQDKSIDSYYMRSGDLAGGISLGVFSRRESAEVAQTTLARRGYQTQISEIFRQEQRSWLQLQASAATILEGPDWQAFRAKHSALSLTENVCEVVASPTQFP